MSLKNIRQLFLFVLIGIFCAVGGYRLGVQKTTVALSGVSQVDTSAMDEVLTKIKGSYLRQEDIDSKKLMYGAASGLVSSLGDPYTAFYPPKENTRSKADLQGEFGGVGIQLGFSKDKILSVMAPIKDSPAMKAGIKAGDLILKIVDEEKKINKDTSGINIEDAVDMIRGLKGTTVTLNIFSDGDKEPRDIALVRDTINVPSTELEWLDNNRIAVLRVNKFGEQTLAEWDKFVDEIVAKKAKGVILDLRNNPGGYLQRAIDLGSEFIKDGVIVKQRDKTKTETFTVDRPGRLIGMPLVVLINRGSASASEILSGALRERLGTKLIGENSFGKGTVQEVDELSNGAGVHITVAEWLMPSGTNIHGVGLKPDVEVKYVFDEKNPKKDNQMDKALEVLKTQIK